MREAPSPIPREAKCQGGSKKDLLVKKQPKTAIALNVERLTATLRSAGYFFFFSGRGRLIGRELL